ncbi:hypothetical protein HDK77DRAFT_484062 [Phyllosticta capitalensis]
MPKARSGLPRTHSSLDVTASFEAFKPFDGPKAAENEKMDAPDSLDIASVQHSYCPTTPTPAPRTPTDNDKVSVAAERLSQSIVNQYMVSEAAQEPTTPTKVGGNSKMVAEGLAKDVMDDVSSSTTFYGGIHQAYKVSCGELNALFGEVKLEGLRSKTKREVCQVELFHLLAVSTDDPGTYYGSIRRVGQICKTMSNRPVAENLWKKTLHITYELDEDFAAKRSATGGAVNTPAQALSTIVEEDDDHLSNNQPGYIHPNQCQSGDDQCDPHQESPSVTAFSDKVASTSGMENHKTPRHTRSMANSANFPFLPEEDLAKKAFNEYVDKLSEDALRRKEATDRYIANLEDDLAARKYATDQFIAELEDKVRKMG